MVKRVKNCGRNVQNMLREFIKPETETENGTKNELGEYLTQKGAMALAKRLEGFWHSQGYAAARFWAEPIGERFEKVGTYEIYRVTSNLINGLPPRYQPGYQAT